VLNEIKGKICYTYGCLYYFFTLFTLGWFLFEEIFLFTFIMLTYFVLLKVQVLALNANSCTTLLPYWFCTKNSICPTPFIIWT
jgi:hypothetical protein